jgi:hypothetical protein
MLEAKSRIPHSQEAMHTMQKWHKPLGNQVTFDLINIGANYSLPLRCTIVHHARQALEPQPVARLTPA